MVSTIGFTPPIIISLFLNSLLLSIKEKKSASSKRFAQTCSKLSSMFGLICHLAGFKEVSNSLVFTYILVTLIYCKSRLVLFATLQVPQSVSDQDHSHVSAVEPLFSWKFPSQMHSLTGALKVSLKLKNNLDKASAQIFPSPPKSTQVGEKALEIGLDWIFRNIGWEKLMQGSFVALAPTSC